MAVASWGAGPEPQLRNRLRRWVGNTCLRSRSRLYRRILRTLFWSL